MNEVRATADIDDVLRRVLRVHAPLLVIVSMYVGACVVLTQIYEIETNLIYGSFEQFAFITVFYIIIYLIYVLIVLHPHRPVSYLLNQLRNTSTERYVSFFLVIAAISVHITAFKYIKSMIPLINPFSWDSTFARWDAALHGTDAWKIIHPYLSHPIITIILVGAYTLYFFVVLPVVPWYAAKNNSKNRMQFLLTFALCWVILGSVMAIIFSSAGPCFYNNVIPGSERYAELMSYLHSPTTPASIITDSHINLWNLYTNREYGYHFAISAMPSMHIALTFLLVLVSRRRITRILSIIFTILVALGCVHFAWHYAIDVYVGIIGAWLIWWIVGLCLRRQLPFSRWRTQNAPR